MMVRIWIILLFTAGCFFESSAQYITAEQYIQKHKEMAIREMKRMGVPAAITLAQGLLETENGNSELVKESNNHFGIKCKSSWTAGSVSHDDDAPGECFRMYKDADDSYRDHSNFLRANSRYAFLFKLDPTDYKGWAYGLRKAGYATNPKYPDILIKNIETNHLEQYSLEAAGDVPVFDASKYTDDPEDNSSLVAENTPLQDAYPGTGTTKLTVNGSRALFVSKGTSLLAIATQNNINLSKLLGINDLTKDGLLEKDQFVFLEKKQKEGNRDFCIVAPDETLYDIAQKNGVLLQSLYNYNQLNSSDNLIAGTKVFLKPQVTMVTATFYPASPDVQPNLKNETVNPKPGNSNLKPGDSNLIPDTSNGAPQIHEVQSKEGLYSISKKYGVSIEQIKEWNNLQNDHLKIGQQLIISK